jgi:hypothetical protein
MDNEQRHHPGRPIRDPGTAGPSTSGSTRQTARNKGLARVSAITLGAGAASTVGALAIAVTLANPTVTAGLNSAPAASTTNNTRSAGVGSTNTNGHAGENGDDDSGEQGSRSQQQVQPAAPQPQLQPAAPPSNTNNPPAATSGAS